jgi:hypothetical protein
MTIATERAASLIADIGSRKARSQGNFDAVIANFAEKQFGDMPSFTHRETSPVASMELPSDVRDKVLSAMGGTKLPPIQMAHAEPGLAYSPAGAREESVKTPG